MLKFRKTKNSQYRSCSAGQTMMLTVIVLSSTLLSIAVIGGLIMLYQIRHAGDFTNSGKAIFAADSGVNWWNCFISGACSGGSNSSATINSAFGNGASFTIEEIAANKVKIVGQARSSKRAFLFESISSPPGPIPCDQPIDLMILVEDTVWTANPILGNIKTALNNFIDKLASSTHVGLVSYNGSTTLSPLASTSTAKGYISAIPASTSDSINLGSAIDAATAELKNHSDPAPDYIIIITKSTATDPPPQLTAEGAAITAANTAKIQNFIKILAAYGGTDQHAIDFYANNADHIVSSPPASYFSNTSDFDSPANVPITSMLSCR